MKTIFSKLIISLILISITGQLSAQEKEEDQPKSSINLLARYTVSENSVDLRFFPDKKSVLYTGLKSGFFIERADITVLKEGIESIDELDFITIGKVAAYNDEQWETIMANSNAQDRKELELTKDFLKGIDDKKAGSFSFEEGIKAMKEQKSKEDFEYLIFVMSAIKNAKVALALGLSFNDSTVEKNKTYIYRVGLLEKPVLYEVISSAFSVETKEGSSRIQRKIYTKPGDTKLSFLWEENDGVSGALVERFNEVSSQWESLTKAPIYTLGNSIRNSFIDEGLTNYKKYKYRFYGYTSFGERVQFGEAEAMPKDLTPPTKPIFKQAKHTKPNEIEIKWDTQKPEDKDLKGFIIARGEENKGKFSIIHQNILAKETRIFTDKTFKKDRTNYYVIQAIDTAGNISSTIPAFVTIIDSVPPVKPRFLKAEIDSLGVVTLGVKLNKEKDLMGYRLYRSNSEKHEFSVIREGFDGNDSIPKPVQIVFKDTVTLNSLTPYIYYRIKALDQNFNQSVFSDILKVKRPDKIAPTIPVFKDVKVKTDEVELYFALSNSIDVVEQILYRRLSFDAKWEQLALLEKEQNKYIDKKVKQGTKYYYTIQSKDDSGNLSDYAVAVFGQPYDDGVRPVITDFKLNVGKNNVLLSWNYPEKYQNPNFVIYKKNRKGHLVQYKNVKNKLFQEKLSQGTFEYAIKVFTPDGGESKISKLISVSIQ